VWQEGGGVLRTVRRARLEAQTSIQPFASAF
jgi:hypothetical protein